MKIFLIIILSMMCVNWMEMILSLTILFSLISVLGKHDMDWFYLSMMWNMDTISYLLILLSVWITMLMILASKKIFFYSKFSNFFNAAMLILLFLLVAAFSSSNLLMFYIFFEASLIPILFLILGWGYQPERLQAGIYMMMYTILASLPLLLVILFISWESNSLMIIELNINSINGGLMFFLGASLAFMVKLPVFVLHLWLPKAHVEAPVAGSMILASILLKLGGYGLIRMVPKISATLPLTSWYFMAWGAMGGLFVSMVCLRQVDIKVLIALSSVAHMALVYGGILTMTSWGINGATLIMMGHGFCSSGLFCIAGMAYERAGTRSLSLIKGHQTFLPGLTLWWFLLAIANMSAPPSMNLIGEINAIVGAIQWSPMMCIPIVGLTFFAAAYSLYMYSNTQHGKTSISNFGTVSPDLREHLILLAHWVPINFLVVKFSSLQLFLCFSSLYKNSNMWNYSN
uniref:NADH-ubiquinone oxidoreductase chain 4 n=1 Tax=Bragasellus molinai TaxID=1281925 RepID=A0A485MEC1_9CRUS|nr:NADH dehydrogenase subunit 4 [Bragasellus molinai]